jgi:hypothetical protein
MKRFCRVAIGCGARGDDVMSHLCYRIRFGTRGYEVILLSRSFAEGILFWRCSDVFTLCYHSFTTVLQKT